jgi:hypothetical protein
LFGAFATHSATKITPSSPAFQATVVPRHGSPPTSCVFEDGKLAEHWEVLQDEATKAESLSGLPMFGDRFLD